MNKLVKYIRKFVRYMYRTYQLKLYAIALMVCGSVPAIIDHDLTCLVFMSMFAIPLFFVDTKWIMKHEKMLRGED